MENLFMVTAFIGLVLWMRGFWRMVDTISESRENKTSPIEDKLLEDAQNWENKWWRMWYYLKKFGYYFVIAVCCWIAAWYINQI